MGQAASDTAHKTWIIAQPLTAMKTQKREQKFFDRSIIRPGVTITVTDSGNQAMSASHRVHGMDIFPPHRHAIFLVIVLFKISAACLSERSRVSPRIRVPHSLSHGPNVALSSHAQRWLSSLSAVRFCVTRPAQAFPRFQLPSLRFKPPGLLAVALHWTPHAPHPHDSGVLLLWSV